MSDHTPFFPENLEDYAPWVATHGLVAPYGKCQCGCGAQTPIAAKADSKRGLRKGDPCRLSVPNCGAKIPLIDGKAPWAQMFGLKEPYGKCQCGCGQDAPVAKTGLRGLGFAMGEPTRYISGHSSIICGLEEKFWQNTERGAPDECWLWVGSKYANGYGRVHYRRQSLVASRVCYELHYGSIPSGMQVCHKCDTPLCVNPSHLFLGTSAENTADKVKKGRQARGSSLKTPFTENDVIRIRDMYAAGTTQVEIARMYGVRQCSISAIVLRKSWKHVE